MADRARVRQGSAKSRYRARSRGHARGTRWAIGVSAAAVLVAVGWLGLRNRTVVVRPTGIVGTAVGDTAPAFHVPDIQGQLVGLSAGEPTLLYFVAAWCSSCAYGESQLRQVYDRYGRQVHLITVDVDPGQDTLQMVNTFVKDYGGPWPTVLDQHQELTRLYRVTALDSSDLISSGGVIVYAAQAPLSATQWDARLRSLLARTVAA